MRPRADTLLAWTGAPCSYGCSTCPIDAGSARNGLQAADLQRALNALPERAGRLVVLVGGEPFLRPDLMRLIATIRASGCAAGLVTTGRALVYPQIRERLRRAGVVYLRLQFFGYGPAHDRATAVPGAFEQALTGLRAWLAEAATAPAEAACDVDVALVERGVPVANLAVDIPGLARAIAAPSVQLVISCDALGGGDMDAAEGLAPFAHWNDDATRPLLAWEGLAEPASPAAHLTIPPLPPAFVGGAPRACCLGPIDQMVRTAATHAPQTLANSFNFLRTATTVPHTADADSCSAYASAGDGDPQRQLWLIDGDRLVLHETDTGDFPNVQIARIKDELSHVFLDCAPAGVLDDFTNGMRRVLPDPVCQPCRHRARCGRRFEMVDGAPFAREEAWITAHVAGLRGNVLDVGCGEQLYRETIFPLVRTGVIRYHGLDPDAHSLEGLRAALPEGRFSLGGIENFRGQLASYDHILCLRSLNHVDNLDEALARMAELLKPGGLLLLVETTPFALLRRPEQVAEADRAPRAGHQHFRNVASSDIMPLARHRSLHVLLHHPARLESTNEWILLLARGTAAAIAGLPA